MTDGDEVELRMFADGKVLSDSMHGCDLINIPERIKRDVWLNVYPNCVSAHTDEESAKIGKDYPSSNCLACIKVTLAFDKGEGL
jgi:hypothetical protein